MRTETLFAVLFAVALQALGALSAAAQENYEIQVYGSDTVEPGKMMVEVHSNFTFQPADHHALHETLELTYGFNSWFETGFYVFTSAAAGQGVQTFGPGDASGGRQGWQWVGDHVRPRVRVPESWGWPVGVSLSTELGYQRHAFSEDTWTWEIRPILDKKLGRWYFSFNPALEKSIHGANAGRGFEFSPSLKASYDATSAVTLGVEYYGSLGPVSGFDPVREQQHQIVPAIDLNLSPDWELNVGAAFGVTHATDRFLLKMIVGRRFDF